MAGWFSGLRSRLQNQRSRLQIPAVIRDFCKEQFAKVSHRMGDQNLPSRGTSCFGRHVKPLPRLHLQSLAPPPVLGLVDVRQAAGRKNNCRIFITT
jgi:hypothetical protein